MKREADVDVVVRKITDRVFNRELADRLVRKVRRYDDTKNPADDLTPPEASQVYRFDEYGAVVPFSNKRDLDIDWSSHASYRSDLRDVPHDVVNDALSDRLKETLQKGGNPRGTVRLKEPGLGTMVVDKDLTSAPAEAKVVTVWASRITSERLASLSDAIVTESIAKRVAFEFETQDELDAYLKKHPKADKSKHWVRKEKSKDKPVKDESDKSKEKTPEKAEPEYVRHEKGFAIPKHPMVDVKVEGDLSNVANWKAKIQVGNSLTSGMEEGDYDDVGYVAINSKGDDIVPIARSDEHRSGYEYLYKLSKKGGLKGRVQDYITLFRRDNYPEHFIGNKAGKAGKELKEWEEGREAYVSALKKWRSYGGRNLVIQSWGYVTDADEFIERGGDISKSDKPSKPASRLMDSMLSAMTEQDESKAKEHLSNVSERMRMFDGFVRWPESRNYREAVNSFHSVLKSGDVREARKQIAKISQLTSDALPDGYDVTQFFGHGEEGKKRLVEIAALGKKSDDANTEKTEKDKTPAKPKGLSDTGKTTVRLLRDTAEASKQEGDKFFEEADGLVKFLKGKVGDLKDEELDKLLTSAASAISSNDKEKLMELLFAFNGIKNHLHNQLRGMKEKGEEHALLGDAETAYEEFRKLGDI